MLPEMGFPEVFLFMHKRGEGKRHMAIEVSYIIITPYSLLKSRTGGIIARLMAM